MVEIDREKLAAAAEILGMEKEAVGGILARMAQRLGGGYAREAAKRGIETVAGAPVTETAKAAAPGIMSKLKSLGLKLGLLGGAGAGLYQLGKADQPPAAPMPVPMMPPGGAFSPIEQMQFARHGIDPERLRFAQTLGRLRQGMNLEQKMFERALAGKLPGGVLGGGDEEESLEAYA